MRISLVLITVLALATSAHASLSLFISCTTVWVGSDVTVNVSSTDSSPWVYYFVLSEDTYNWTDPVSVMYYPNRTEAVSIKTCAGNMASAIPDPAYAALIQLNADGTATPPSAGVQFEITIRGVQEGIIYIDLQDGSANSQIGGALTPFLIIPEPSSAALIALGALFIKLHRRHNGRNSRQC